MVKHKARIVKKSKQLPKPIIDHNRPIVEDKNPTAKEVETYQKAAKQNLEGTTRVTRQEQAKKKIGHKDAGESESIKNMKDAIKKDPSILARIKNMVKKW